MACRTRRTKGELLRVVRVPSGEVRVDPGGRAAGRGAYVCRRAACARTATRKGLLGRAVRARLGPEDLATLRREMEKEIA